MEHGLDVIRVPLWFLFSEKLACYSFLQITELALSLTSLHIYRDDDRYRLHLAKLMWPIIWRLSLLRTLPVVHQKASCPTWSLGL